MIDIYFNFDDRDHSALVRDYRKWLFKNIGIPGPTTWEWHVGDIHAYGVKIHDESLALLFKLSCQAP